MKGEKWIVWGTLASLVLLSGCGVSSYRPWLEPEDAIKDRRLAGVWLAEPEEDEEEDTDIEWVIVSPGEEPGIYNIIIYNVGYILSGSEESTLRPPPFHLEGSLHEVKGQLLAQVSGSTVDNMEYSLLLAPMYMVFRATFEDETLRLYELDMPAGWKDSGLKFYDDKYGDYTLFSETKELTAFLLAHLDDPELFEDEPIAVLNRVSDLSKPPPKPVAPED